MKQETYDIPAYKFALIIPRGSIYATDERYGKELKNYAKDGEIVTAPWENFDGLTVGEVLNSLNQKGFAFICYTIWKDKNGIPTSHNVSAPLFSIFTPDFAQTVINEPLDKLLENHLETIYPNANDIVKKICRCFFERYQDKDYQETVGRVKKIINKNSGK